MKPVSQREISLGAEKKLAENVSLSVRLVNKHLIRTIEDIGVLTPAGEMYYTDNPGVRLVTADLQGRQVRRQVLANPQGDERVLRP